jgi:hypothetical protein
MVAVLIFGVVFMVGFGIWHAPILQFASESLPNLTETMTQISTNSTGPGGGVVDTPGGVLTPMTSSSLIIAHSTGTSAN